MVSYLMNEKQTIRPGGPLVTDWSRLLVLWCPPQPLSSWALVLPLQLAVAVVGRATCPQSIFADNLVHRAALITGESPTSLVAVTLGCGTTEVGFDPSTSLVEFDGGQNVNSRMVASGQVWVAAAHVGKLATTTAALQHR